jgi:hypothetical protein
MLTEMCISKKIGRGIIDWPETMYLVLYYLGRNTSCGLERVFSPVNPGIKYNSTNLELLLSFVVSGINKVPPRGWPMYLAL